MEKQHTKTLTTHKRVQSIIIIIIRVVVVVFSSSHY